LQFQIMWIAISLGISLALSFLLPFPLNFIAMLGVFLGMNYFMRRRQMRMMGMRGGDSFFGGGLGGSSMFGQQAVEYYCMSCGTKHNQRSCPNCGSNMKRIG